MEFRLYNTMTRQVEPVETRTPGLLRIYSCGPTVYSYAHIGNFRTFLTTDLILRTAKAIGWQTRYVSNITDVGHLSEDDFADLGGEDRMAKALSSEEGQQFPNVWSLADHYTNVLCADWSNLNLLEPDIRPRATQHMREQILTIEQLIASGHAYETENAVYFSVPSFPDYGKLSGNRDREALAEAVRDVVVDPEKRDPRDFALWKKDDKHLMQWYSPWGWGFPGWHLECSVMATQYLGEHIDVHAGGEDLIFPHHECEIAQAESLSDPPFAQYWVHSRFLQVEGKKMSKSEGNYLVPRQLTAPESEGGRGISPLALRLALISGYYRKPFNFTYKNLEDSVAIVDRLQSAARRALSASGAAEPGATGHSTGSLAESLDMAYGEVLAAMCDDLNTPKAIAGVMSGLKMLERSGELSPSASATAVGWFDRVNTLLGIISHGPVSGMADSEAGRSTDSDGDEEAIETLIAERNKARASKDWERADQIRVELAGMGVVLKDGPDGTTWSRN
jgi:cysteinyl-tRNA synthetase